MRLRPLSLCVALAVAVLTAAPASLAQREVNLTADSKPGWLPSEDLEKQATETALAYLAAQDTGRFDQAWAMLDPHTQAMEPLEAFAKRVGEFNANAGAPLQRRITRATWTADPAQAPEPGVYVSLDLVSRFAGIDRHCGYLVLHQPPLGGPFKVTREEDNLLTDATARDMAAKGQDVDAAWAQLSARCPNYAGGRGPAPPPPLPESHVSTVGYPNTAAALAGLKARPGVVFSSKDGWTIANDPSDNAVWSFAPAGQPAYPAVIRRKPVKDKGQVTVRLDALCEGPKPACDDLIRAFEAADNQIAAQLR
jgi:hypothetical protein